MATVVVVIAVVGLVCAVRSRDVPRGITAIALVAYVLFSSPALQIGIWPPLTVALQALVPTGLAIAALVICRRRPTGLELALAVIATGLATSWAVTAFIPLWLEGFLLLQISTLAVTSLLTGLPFLYQTAQFIQRLWTSAEIR